jgi:hypothetical protein
LVPLTAFLQPLLALGASFQLFLALTLLPLVALAAAVTAIEFASHPVEAGQEIDDDQGADRSRDHNWRTQHGNVPMKPTVPASSPVDGFAVHGRLFTIGWI